MYTLYYIYIIYVYIYIYYIHIPKNPSWPSDKPISLSAGQHQSQFCFAGYDYRLTRMGDLSFTLVYATIGD